MAGESAPSGRADVGVGGRTRLTRRCVIWSGRGSDRDAGALARRRQHLQGFLLRHGRTYPGKKRAGRSPTDRWLTTVRFQHPAQQIESPGLCRCRRRGSGRAVDWPDRGSSPEAGRWRPVGRSDPSHAWGSRSSWPSRWSRGRGISIASTAPRQIDGLPRAYPLGAFPAAQACAVAGSPRAGSGLARRALIEGASS